MMKSGILSSALLVLHVCAVVWGQGSPNPNGQPPPPGGQPHQETVQVHPSPPEVQPDQQVHVGQPTGQHGQPVRMNQEGSPNIIKVRTQDKDHIMEHLDGVIDKPESEMTPEELQQHYFKMHDYDSNDKLDGTELVQAITHYHQEEDKFHGSMGEEELMSLLDPIFLQEDRNNDGYIDYPEYAKSQRDF